MAYNHYEPTNVAPTGSGQALTGLNITWDVETVSDSNYYYPFIEWRIYLNGSRIYTSSSNDLRSYSYGSTLSPSTDYTILVERYCRKKDIYGDAYPYYKTFSETANFRTIEYPQSFSLTAPVNGASGLAVRPTLSWEASSYAHGYKVYVDGALEVTTISTSFTFTRDLNWGSSHSWYVQAYRNDNPGTYTTPARTFTVMAEPLPPAKAEIVLPLNDAVDIARSTSLQFKDGTGGNPAASYDIYFGINSQSVTDAITSSSEFKANQSHSGSTDTTQSFMPPSLGNDCDYYWRVDAVNLQGTTKGDTWHFKTIAVSIGSPVNKMYRKKLIALADDKFWYEDSDRNMVSLGSLEIDTGDGLDLTQPVDVLAAYQKIFIANGMNKKVVDFSNTRLTVSALSHIPQRGGILTQATGAAIVVDYIDTANKYIYGFVTNGTFAAGSNASITEDGVGYDYPVTAVLNVGSVPLYYNWDVYPDNDDQGDIKVNGNMPQEPAIMSLYRGKIVLSGDKNSPHVIYMSDSANPFRWVYGTDDASGASALSSGFAGSIGDIVTACVPYEDDYMLIGCSQSIWLLRGDPADGGSIDQVSFTTGMFDKNSFTFDEAGNFYYLDANGVYILAAGFGQTKSLTIDRMPDFADQFPLITDVHRVKLLFDKADSGILIFKTDLDTGDNENFWFDLRTKGFFREIYPADCSIYSGCFYCADNSVYRKLLLGCRDGYIRRFDKSLFKDQNSNSYQAIDSNIFIGPGKIATGSDFEAIIAKMRFVLGRLSGDIDISLYCEKTAEDVVANAVNDQNSKFSSQITSGMSNSFYPRVRGVYAVLKIANDRIDESFQLEKIIAKVRSAGFIR